MPSLSPAASSNDFDHASALEACARGDRYALRAIYEREAGWLLAVVRRIVRDPDLAQDVLQEALLLVWQRAASYQRALGSARGWIYTVVRHKALDEVRRHRPELAVGDALEGLAEGQGVEAAALAARDAAGARTEAIEHCLDGLEPSRRDCIVLAFVEGYTHAQIAQRVQAPVGTVKSWIRRGLLALKECLS
jgi:RNA polymerase sigma factor (sigma-70 family)